MRTLALPDGSVVDFVDVPGHDRLVGNMLVGAGEIDAALLVVAADDGPNAQTLEHLGLLDALGIRDGLAVVTKADLVDEARLAVVEAEVARPARDDDARRARRSSQRPRRTERGWTACARLSRRSPGASGRATLARRRTGRASRSTACSRSRVAGPW